MKTIPAALLFTRRMRTARAVLACGAAIALAACASYSPRGLVPGQSTLAQVQASMGQPREQIKTTDGGSTLFYPNGPEGLTTYAVHMRPDGVVGAVGQTLTPHNVALLDRGIDHMTVDEVRALLGPPNRVIHFARQGLTAWDYRMQDVDVHILSPEFSDDGVLREVAYVLEKDMLGVPELRR